MADEVLEEEAGADGATSGGATLVANTSTEIVVANDSRSMLIVSATVDPIWLSYGSAAVVGSGIYVAAGGAPFIDRDWKGSVYAISTGPAVVGWTETSYNVGDDEGEDTPGAEEFVPSGPSDGHPSTDVAEYFVAGE